MSATVVPLDRRAVLKGLAGVTLALPLLEAMGKEVAEKTPRRFCAMYTANGMSLPNPKHGIDEWSWFPKTEGRAFEFGKSTEPLRSTSTLVAMDICREDISQWRRPSFSHSRNLACR